MEEQHGYKVAQPMAEHGNMGTQWDWDAHGNKVAQPMAEQPANVAHPRVTFAPELPPISTLPPCRPPMPDPFSMEKEQLESFCHSMHSLCNRLKKRVGLLEKESIEDIHKFEELSDICQSHALRFVQAEDQFHLVTTNFADQFNRLNDQSHYRADWATEQRAVFTESFDSLQTDLSKLTESVALVRTEFGQHFL